MSSLRVSGNVDSWCTRCKMMLAHTIEAMVGSECKRVQCNTCRSSHVHRASPPGTKIYQALARTPVQSTDKTRKMGPKKNTAGLARASHYSELMRGRDTLMARSYSFREQFAEGEVLAHSQFGVGLVVADKGANKIEVLFQEGPKVLAHRR